MKNWLDKYDSGGEISVKDKLKPKKGTTAKQDVVPIDSNTDAEITALINSDGSKHTTSKLLGEIKFINTRGDGYGIMYDTPDGEKYEVVNRNAFKGLENVPELRRYRYKRGELNDPSMLDNPKSVELLKKGWQSSGYNPSTVSYPESIESYRQAIGQQPFYTQEQLDAAKAGIVPQAQQGASVGGSSGGGYMQYLGAAMDLFGSKKKESAPTSQQIPDPNMEKYERYRKSLELESMFKTGGVINDEAGQWKHPGEITRIPSGDITMKNVGYPVIGFSEQGEVQMMLPENDYQYEGNSVIELPLNQASKKDLSNKAKSSKFTKKSSGWLSKYK